MSKRNQTAYFLLIVTIFYALLIYTEIINPERSQSTYNESVFEKQGDKKIIIAFRNDDLSANSSFTHEESVLNIFWKHGIKQTFAVIPKRGKYTNSLLNTLPEKKPILEALENWLKEGKIEFALHGYSHRRSEGSSGEFDGIPYNSQFERIGDGKRIIDKAFDNNVNIFAPPWNQADINTVNACLSSGIHIFSGYLGEVPAEGMTFVNTNAVLFPIGNRMGEGTGLPCIRDVLKHAKNGKGTTFIITFYHSNSDFKNPEDYSYLENVLGSLTNDSLIEISSIGEIAENYREQLPAYNQAGLNLKQAAMSQHRAKPYILLHRKFQNIIGKHFGIDLLYNDAFSVYWTGSYKRASEIGIEIIKRCDAYIVYGRIMAVLLSGVVLILFLGLLRCRKINLLSASYKGFLVASLAPFIIAGGYLNIFTPVSPLRIEEFNIFTGLYAGGIILEALVLTVIATKRKNPIM